MRRSYVAAGLIAALALVAGWNTYKYPSGSGYDVRQHREYADLLIHHGEIPGPKTRSEYYTPPVFYALAGAATYIGEHVHSGDPHKLGQVLNWFVLLATAVVLWFLARELFPRRPWAQLSALAFFCFLPVVLRVGAMFHPEPLSMLFSAVALLLATRMLGRREYGWQLAVATGVALGLGQLVRAFSLWTLAAVVLAFAVARAWRPLAVIVLAAAVVTAPWYVRQARQVRQPGLRPADEAPGDLGSPARAVLRRARAPRRRDSSDPAPLRERGDSDDVQRGLGGLLRRLGDGQPRASRASSGCSADACSRSQGGSCCSCRSRRLPARLPVALLPGLGLLGYLYFTVSYPTPDGDVLKASYMLTTAPAWALAFGYAVDPPPRPLRVSRRRAFLAASALASLPFLLY